MQKGLQALDANRDSSIPFRKIENLSRDLQITRPILNSYCKNHKFGKAMVHNSDNKQLIIVIPMKIAVKDQEVNRLKNLKAFNN